MKHLKFIIIVFLLAKSPLFASTKLSGIIESLVLEQSGNPFVVTGDILIPVGKKLEVKDGCVFLFKPFTGITIEGEMVVNGTNYKPVIFTSENDDKYNQESTQFPNPFDWNGILISKKAGVVIFSNFIIKYSVYGLKSYKEDFLISNGVFSGNGQSNVTVQGVMKNIADGIPFNYKMDPDDKIEPEERNETRKVVKPEKVSVVKKPKRPGAWHRPVAIATGVTGLAVLGVSGYFLFQKNNYAKKYSAAGNTQDQMNDFVSKQESSLQSAAICAVSGSLLCAGGVVFYLWDKKQIPSKKVSVSPIFGNLNGVFVSFDYY
jgi:hypothetical protein